MSHKETSERCERDDTAAQAKGALADRYRAGETSPGAGPDVPGLLARIPDVAAPGQGSAAEAGPGSRDGRILSPGLSAKILLGGGLSLLLVALMPFVFGRKQDPEPSSANDAGGAKQQSPAATGMARKGEPKPAEAVASEAVATDESRSDNGPAEDSFAEKLRKQLDAGAQGQLASQPAPTQARPDEQASRAVDSPRGNPRGPVPAEVPQPPARYPTTQHPFAYDAPGRGALPETNRPMTLRDGARAPDRYEAKGGQGGYRYPDTGYGPEVVANRRPGVQRADYRNRQTGDGRRDYDRAWPSARVADVRQAAGPRHSTGSASSANEPGVARFMGTIEKPTARMTHDGAGSSIY